MRGGAMRQYKAWFNFLFFWAPMAVVLLLNLGHYSGHLPSFGISQLALFGLCGFLMVAYFLANLGSLRFQAFCCKHDEASWPTVGQAWFSLVLGLMTIWHSAIGLLKAVAVLFVTLFSMSTSSASKKDVAYHVEFVADGTPYGGTAKYTWYDANNISTGFRAKNFEDTFVRGTLRDGTKYVAYSREVSGSSYGRIKVNSIIFLQVTPGLAESFDNTRTHSSRHTVRIINSYVDIGNEHVASYREAEDVRSASAASEMSANYYYTIGAKITPFNEPKHALSDFFNMGPPTYPVPEDYKKPEFLIHPFNADIEYSDADVTFNNGVFDVVFPSSGLAAPWVMAPAVHTNGAGITGRRPNIVINIHNERTSIPNTVTVNAAIDPVTGKAVDFYEDDIALRF